MKEYMEKFKSFVLADETLEKVSGGSGSVSNSIRISSSCVGCGICVDRCPGGCIKIVGGRAVVDQDACFYCCTCETECPVGAIHIDA